ncbi:hypothetical protein NC651_007208 [Populus alba x Populus x berolinensis]|nr:hypothetical protein NC651_007208 [Populus alba x Populus x berolinensis]
MSVFSNAFYIEMKEFFSGDRILARKPPYYRTVDVPDICGFLRNLFGK